MDYEDDLDRQEYEVYRELFEGLTLEQKEFVLMTAKAHNNPFGNLSTIYRE